MRLVKDNREFITNDEDVIPAFLEAGWTKAEDKPAKEAKSSKDKK